ncbi:hypothetical protein BDQ17DRAFT_1326799 [Cyathus striatus]|nr:hypothetical protein BDQ17DRAFT_1326799 [Cyathus striatus]
MQQHHVQGYPTCPWHYCVLSLPFLAPSTSSTLMQYWGTANPRLHLVVMLTQLPKIFTESSSALLQDRGGKWALLRLEAYEQGLKLLGYRLTMHDLETRVKAGRRTVDDGERKSNMYAFGRCVTAGGSVDRRFPFLVNIWGATNTRLKTIILQASFPPPETKLGHTNKSKASYDAKFFIAEMDFDSGLKSDEPSAL